MQVVTFKSNKKVMWRQAAPTSVPANDIKKYIMTHN